MTGLEGIDVASTRARLKTLVQERMFVPVGIFGLLFDKTLMLSTSASWLVPVSLVLDENIVRRSSMTEFRFRVGRSLDHLYLLRVSTCHCNTQRGTYVLRGSCTRCWHLSMVLAEALFVRVDDVDGVECLPSPWLFRRVVQVDRVQR